MAELLDALDDDHIRWIEAQPVFFVASAPERGGHVNVSPKGYDSFRVLDPHRVAYLDLTGSGAETIAHVRENGRLTIMFCAFAGRPRILRLYGTATTHLIGTEAYDRLVTAFPEIPGARAVIEVALDRIHTSCGFAVPFMSLDGERPTLDQWARRQGDDGLSEYRAGVNATSIDGLPAIDP